MNADMYKIVHRELGSKFLRDRSHTTLAREMGASQAHGCTSCRTNDGKKVFELKCSDHANHNRQVTAQVSDWGSVRQDYTSGNLAGSFRYTGASASMPDSGQVGAFSWSSTR